MPKPLDVEVLFDAILELVAFVTKRTDWTWDDMAPVALKAMKATILGLFGSEDQLQAGATLPTEVSDKIQEIGSRFRDGPQDAA